MTVYSALRCNLLTDNTPQRSNRVLVSFIEMPSSLEFDGQL